MDSDLRQCRAEDGIRRLRSWEPEARLQLRCRLNNAAMNATARAQRATSPEAELLFRQIARIAGDWSMTWRPDAALEEQLEDVLEAMTRAFLAADCFERCGVGL